MLVDLHNTPAGRLRAVFRFDQPRSLVVEISINPVGGGVLPHQDLARILKTVREATLARSADANFDGDWGGLMEFATACHDAVRSIAGHVITTFRIEDSESHEITATKGAELTAAISRQSLSAQNQLSLAARVNDRSFDF